MPRCTTLPINQWLHYGDEKWDIPESGFDTCVRPYRSFGTSRNPTSEFSLGDTHPNFGNMYVSSLSFQYPKNSTIELDVTFKGLRTDKGTKRTARAYGEKISTTNDLGVGAPGGILSSEVSEAKVSVTESYILLSQPNMSQVSTAGTPQDPTDVPPYLWALITDPIYIYPNGWVLENRVFDQINGADVYFVTDEWVYYHPFKP